MQVTDKLKVGDKISVVLTGDVSSVKNGSKLFDDKGRVYTVNSVGMVKYKNGETRNNELHALISPIEIDVGQELTLMQ